MFRVAEYYRVPNYSNYSRVNVLAEAIKMTTSETRDASIKPVRNTSLRGRVVSTS